MKKWYEVHNYAQGDEYITEGSDINNTDNVWTTKIPWDFKPADGYEPSKPYRFSTKVEATRIKDQIKAVRLDEWNRNSHIYKIYGDKKPSWKVYSFSEQTGE
jgi:hypothetical protein